MASRFPLILDETNNQLRELPVGDDLDLTGNNLTGLSSLSTTGGITAGGTITAPLVLATNATVSGTVEALTYTVGGLPLLEQVNVPVINACANCIVNKSPEFVNIHQLNYQLDSLSSAEGKGKMGLNSVFGTGLINQDLLEQSRNAQTENPDLGCYEKQ